MDPTVAPPPPPHSAAANHHPYTDSWPEDTSVYKSKHASSSSSAAASTAAPGKLRLMCSSGGHILPRPHDKSLCYVGGETRMVVVDRHTTLQDLTNRVSKTLLRSATTSFTLKYQLPTEDLDSLISVTTDEDLENMIDEYERLNSSKSSRLRLFIFPVKPESVSSIGSFLENSSKSEDWFLNALNGTNSGFSDTSSVNCLLGLEDEISEKKKNVNHKVIVNNSGQDVHSIPDSPMMETTSSFGSASSSPSLANLPPIRVNVDDHPKVAVGGLDEQFSQLSVQQRHLKVHDDGVSIGSPAPVVVAGSPMSSTAISEHSDPFLSYHERSEQGLQMAYLKQQQQHQQQQFHQKQSSGFDLASTDPLLSDGNKNRASDPTDTPDQTRIQIQQQQFQNPSYVLQMPTTPIESQHLHHQKQPQFIQTTVPPPQYIHHHHPSGQIPAASYYQMYPPMDQQNIVYYMPTTQPPQSYNFPLQQKQPNHSDASKTDIFSGVYRTTNSNGPQMITVPSNRQQHPQYVGYEFTDSLPQAQHVYYANQPVSAAQYQTMSSNSHVEANSPQLRTAQP